MKSFFLVVVVLFLTGLAYLAWDTGSSPKRQDAAVVDAGLEAAAVPNNSMRRRSLPTTQVHVPSPHLPTGQGAQNRERSSTLVGASEEDVLRRKIADIDDDIESQQLVTRLNAGALSKPEFSRLKVLLARRARLSVELARRVMAQLDDYDRKAPSRSSR